MRPMHAYHGFAALPRMRHARRAMEHCSLSSRLCPLCTELKGSPREKRSAERSVRMDPPCPYCDQPEASFLRLVLMSAILHADETLLALMADMLQQTGLVRL